MSNELNHFESPVKIFKRSKLPIRALDYNVEVDGFGCRDLLISNGMTPQEISETSVVVNFNDSFAAFLLNGGYQPGSKEVALYTNNFWERYLNYMDVANCLILKKRRPSKTQFRGLLTTSRLSHYLNVAPPERSRDFAEKLISRAISREMSETLTHELKHKLDYHQNPSIFRDTNRLKVAALAGGIPFFLLQKSIFESAMSPESLSSTLFAWGSALWGTFLTYSYIHTKLNPAELSAKAFASKEMRNPRWRNLVTFKTAEDS